MNKSTQQLIEIALIVLICFVEGGAPPPAINESHYLPKAMHYWQPDWCPVDPFLQSADAHVVFYWTVGWLTKFCSLSTVAWIGRLAAWTAFAWSWQRMSRCCLQARFSPVLTAALFIWITGSMNFAGEWVVGGVEGKCFAYACVFAGLTAIAQGRWARAWPWFGLGGAFHVLVGGWSAIAAGLVWLTEPKDQRSALPKMLPALALALVLALPGIVPALMLTADATAEQSGEAARIYVFERLKHHLAPLQDGAHYLEGRTLRFSLPLLAFLFLWRLKHLDSMSSDPERDERRIALERLCRFGAWTFVISVAGLVIELTLWNQPLLAASLLKYYWFRLADVGVALAASLIVCYWMEELFARQAKLAPLALAVVLLIPAWHLQSLSTARWNYPVAPADNKLSGVAAWQEVCQWAKQNTPPESLFLVPRMSQSLSWYAERSSLVTWKDVPQDAASLIDWHERYRDVFLYEDPNGDLVPYASLGAQGTQRIGQLADQYGIDYVITQEYPPLDFPQVMSNAWYTVYQVSPEKQD